MARKNRKSEESDEMETESASAPAENPDASTPQDSMPQEGAVDQSSEEALAQLEDESSSDDLLDDVRRSLIEEEETEKTKKEGKWWRRIGRKDKSAKVEPPPPAPEIDLPATSFQTDLVEDQTQAAEPEEYAQDIDDLIDMLEAEHQEASVETPPVANEVEILPEPEPEVDFEQLKEQAFRPRQADEVESDVRSIALEGGEEVFVEVEAKASDPFEERLKGFENSLRPYRSYIYMAFAFLGIVMAVLASLLIFNVVQQSRPEPVKEVSNLPYPVGVNLLGGWSFNLGRGTLQEGRWEPGGPEWLEGTEVCRWVSLPWSLQLEAVIRTLKPDDPVELVMSNNDKLVYRVYSVYEMTPEEIQAVDANSPCLLIILTGKESATRWVLTALP